MDVTIITVLLFIPGLFIALWMSLSIIGRIRPFPVPSFMGKHLDSNYRRMIQPPEKLIERSGIKEEMRVLEVGCGSGAFTNYISRAVGNNGEVYASDIQPEMLEQLKKKLMHFENRDIKNVTLIECDACNMPFQDNYFDLISMVAVLQEIPDKKKALLEIKRVL
ncbi:MAG: class I SAM-dependent methyltransferase, partial [Methanobacterium sp.]